MARNPTFDCRAAKAALVKDYPGMMPEANEDAFFSVFRLVVTNHGGTVLPAPPPTQTGEREPMHTAIAVFEQGAEYAALAAFYIQTSGEYAFAASEDDEWPAWLDRFLRPIMAGLQRADAMGGRVQGTLSRH